MMNVMAAFTKGFPSNEPSKLNNKTQDTYKHFLIWCPYQQDNFVQMLQKLKHVRPQNDLFNVRERVLS